MTTPNDYLEYQAYAAQQQTVQRRDEHLDQKAESRSAQRRRANLETNEANVRECWPDCPAWLVANLHRSEFARDVLERSVRYGNLTDGQVNAIRRAIAKETDRETTPAPASAAVNVQGGGFSRLVAAFERARSVGLKSPAMEIGDLRLKHAAPGSKNPGHVYVNFATVYMGKITPAGGHSRARCWRSAGIPSWRRLRPCRMSSVANIAARSERRRRRYKTAPRT